MPNSDEQEMQRRLILAELRAELIALGIHPTFARGMAEDAKTLARIASLIESGAEGTYFVRQLAERLAKDAPAQAYEVAPEELTRRSAAVVKAVMSRYLLPSQRAERAG